MTRTAAELGERGDRADLHRWLNELRHTLLVLARQLLRPGRSGPRP
jgi:hypothetical protein